MPESVTIVHYSAKLRTEGVIMQTQALTPLVCVLCNQPVPLATATTDYIGRPTHSDCCAELLADERIQSMHLNERAA
jgi:hypothetical protein